MKELSEKFELKFSSIISTLPISFKKRLYYEIARYGEKAYRRGFQQAIVLSDEDTSIDGDFASDLRHRRDDCIYEICEGKDRAVLIKKSIYYRIKVEEDRPSLIHEIGMIMDDDYIYKNHRQN